MKVSVIMVDGSFRENTYGAKYFTNQDFPKDEFEVIWVEFYQSANKELYLNDKLKIITLGNTATTVYHSSFCFNEGIKQAKGDLLIIPDADVIVEDDFIAKAWDIHQKSEDLVVYGYRCNEVADDRLDSLQMDELIEKCVITNPINYGGCLTVRKKWLIQINGYEQHEIFKSGFHANGLDVYTRFRNFGLAIKWDHSLVLYHPMHALTSEKAPAYKVQSKLIQWRSSNLEYLTQKGLDSEKNSNRVFDFEEDKTEVSTPLPDQNLLSKIKNKLFK